MTLVDVGADVLRAGNDFVFVMRDFFEIFVAALISEYVVKKCLVPVSPTCSVFGIDDRLDCIRHRRIERRAHALEIWWQSYRIGSRLMGVECSPAEEIEPAITWRYIFEAERRQQFGWRNRGVDPTAKPDCLQHQD